MKKLRFVYGLFLLCGVLAFGSFAAGCNGSTAKPAAHTHEYATEWTYDDDVHYKAATCVHSGVQKDKAYHDLVYMAVANDEYCPYDGYACACGYVRVTEGVTPQAHVFKEYPARGDGCYSPYIPAYKVCVNCGYSTEQASVPAKGAHTFELSEWASDDTTHFHASTCGHIDEVLDRAMHTFSNGTCTVCGAAEPAQSLAFEPAGFDSAAYVVTGIGTVSGGDVTVPTLYNGRRVAGIATNAFKNNNTITSIRMPVGLVSIEEGAFAGCTALTKVYTARGLQTVGRTAFAGCTALESVTLGEGLTTIGDSAFDGCTALVSVNVPETVHTIGEQAFAYCASLVNIILPATLAHLDVNTFFNCTSLSEVTLPARLAMIHSQCFYNCTSLRSVYLPESLSFVGHSAFEKSGLVKIDVPDSVTTVGAFAFRDCAALKSAKISKSVISATDNWFSGCGALEELAIPFVGAHTDYKTAKNKTAFGYIFGTVPYEGGVAVEQTILGETTAQDKTYTFYVPHALKKLRVFGGEAKHWVGDTSSPVAARIGSRAFENCAMLELVAFDADIKYVGAGAFSGCTGLKAVSFGTTEDWRVGAKWLTLNDPVANLELVEKYGARVWQVIDRS